VGTTETTINRLVSTPSANVIGTGANQGQLRIRVQTLGGTTNFVTQGNLLLITYDAP